MTRDEALQVFTRIYIGMQELQDFSIIVETMTVDGHHVDILRTNNLYDAIVYLRDSEDKHEYLITIR